MNCLNRELPTAATTAAASSADPLPPIPAPGTPLDQVVTDLSRWTGDPLALAIALVNHVESDLEHNPDIDRAHQRRVWDVLDQLRDWLADMTDVNAPAIERAQAEAVARFYGK